MDCLKVTYGCIVYQEQVIEIFRSLGGYTMGQADNIRRAISKKKMKVIEAERKTFVYGDESQNIDGCISISSRPSPIVFPSARPAEIVAEQKRL